MPNERLIDEKSVDFTKRLSLNLRMEIFSIETDDLLNLGNLLVRKEDEFHITIGKTNRFKRISLSANVS